MFVSGAELLFLEDWSVLCVCGADALGVRKYLSSAAIFLPVERVFGTHTHTHALSASGDYLAL